MKPIILITRMDGGGMETFCLELLAELRKDAGCRLKIEQGAFATLYTSYSGGVRARDVPEGVERVCWDVRAKKSWLKMARWLRTRPDDPCLCLSQELCVVLVVLKRLGIIKNRIFFRESTDVEHHYDAHYWRMMRHILPYCDGLIEQSHVGLEATRRLCGCPLPRTIVIRNIMSGRRSVGTAVPSRPQSASNAYSTHKNCDAWGGVCPAKPIRLIYPASFKPMKGHEWLVRNEVEILDRSGDLVVTFFGDGERRVACERLAKERGLENKFIFEGWMADRDAMYSGADCVVIPSDYEGLPNVMLEAILRGIRVSVRPTCTGACELLREIGLTATWPISAAFAISDETWRAAREKLAALCDPAKVTAQILDFMSPEAALRTTQESAYRIHAFNS